MQIISIINNLSCRSDCQVFYQGMRTIDRRDSVSCCVASSVCRFLELKLHLQISVIPIIECGSVINCEFITIFCLMLPISWSSDNIIQLEAHKFISLEIFIRSKSHFIFYYFFSLPVQRSTCSIFLQNFLRGQLLALE